MIGRERMLPKSQWCMVMGILLLAVVFLFSARARAGGYDLLGDVAPLLIQLEDFGGVEKDGVNVYRWAFGPASSIRFRSSRDTTAVLKIHFRSPLAGQSLGIAANGENLRVIRDIPFVSNSATPLFLELELPVKGGDNVITFTYGDWNFGKSIFVQGDSRRFALCFTGLEIHFESRLPQKTQGSFSRPSLEGFLTWGSVDSFDFVAGSGSRDQALFGTDSGKRPGSRIVETFGNDTSALFSTNVAGTAEVSLSVRSELNKVMKVSANGVPLGEVDLTAAPGAFIGATLRFACVAGLNEIGLHFEHAEISTAGIMPLRAKPTAELAAFSCSVRQRHGNTPL